MGNEGVRSHFSDPTVRNDYYTYDYNVPENLKDTLKIDLKSPSKSLTMSDPSSLTFTSAEGQTLRPLFDTHRTRYVVYWKNPR